MAETTNIEWADSTLNIWEGCQETGSPACVGCYARERNLRYAPKGSTEAPNWGPRAPRREVKSWRSTLRKISRLALAARAAGRTEPWFVFVNSLSDFWDNQANPQLRREALSEFRKHPHLTFLLLTKRPQNIVKMVDVMAEADLGPYADEMGVRSWWPRNVAIGCTVVTQAEAERDLPVLGWAKYRLNPAFAFVSMEPLVEIVWLPALKCATGTFDALAGKYSVGGGPPWGSLDWVITGGATDQGRHKAYPTPYEAFRVIRDHCRAAGVAYMHKQNGEFAEFTGRYEDGPHTQKELQSLVMIHQRFGNTNRVTGSVYRVGKKAAGRLLDGVEHNGRPAIAA